MVLLAEWQPQREADREEGEPGAHLAPLEGVRAERQQEENEQYVVVAAMVRPEPREHSEDRRLHEERLGAKAPEYAAAHGECRGREPRDGPALRHAELEQQAK